MYFIVLLLIPAVLCDCYWNDKTSYGYFGSKTPYNDVRGDIRDVAPLEGCEPINVWFMTRHGTRHPGKDDMEVMKDMVSLKEDILKGHAAGQGHLCAQDIENLQKWNWNNALDSTASELTEEGYQELFELGARFHEKFLLLLQNLDDYHFRPSTEQRTIMSAKAFAEGLGLGKWNFTISEPREKDDVVRPYKHCDNRTAEVLNGSRIHDETSKYHHTKEYKQVLKEVRKRIGIDYDLSPHKITGLYDLCRFYRAYTVTRRDPWCALFSNEDLEIIEYVEDVRHYYRNGYGGGSVHKKLGELALRDLFENFSRGNNVKSITGYFTHDTMIEMVYSALGLYYDYPVITGFERVKNRQWRTSFIAPFAANIVAILNSCNNGTEAESLKIQFLVNEKELHLCNKRACSWEEFNEMFSRYADINLEFCEIGKL